MTSRIPTIPLDSACDPRYLLSKASGARSPTVLPSRSDFGGVYLPVCEGGFFVEVLQQIEG